jgi:hypothetical protein
VSDAGSRPSSLLGAQDAILLLRSRSLTIGLIRCIAATPEWVRNERVRAAIVLHPRTPRPIALGLLPHLRWGDLLQATTTPSLPAPVVIAAERLLTQRLADMALGERITLARAASEPLLKALRKESSPLLLRALLDNPRFRAQDALFVAEQADTPPASLRLLAESPRFRARADLQLSVAAHAKTPPQVALRLLAAMDPGALRCLLDRPSTPALIRVASERRLSGRDSWSPATNPPDSV